MGPTAAYRFQPMPAEVRAIERTDAWGMYRAQMSDYGVRVEFGKRLPPEGEELEIRMGEEWARKHS